MSNLPVGVKNELDDQDMTCTECYHKDDVDNGEYVNHRWYCNSCYNELFKKCPKCEVIILVDDELCEDCSVEKTYEETAQGMFEIEGYSLSKDNEVEVIFSESLETSICNHVVFDLESKTYDAYMNQFTSITTNMGLHKAIHQKLVELKWL